MRYMKSERNSSAIGGVQAEPRTEPDLLLNLLRDIPLASRVPDKVHQLPKSTPGKMKNPGFLTFFTSELVRG